MNCRNCNNTVDGKYCGACGQAVVLKKIDGHYILHEIQHVLHFEKGILYTVKELFTRPGACIRTFIATDRSRLVKPVLFVIITSLVYASIAHLFHVGRHEAELASKMEHTTVGAIWNWIDGHYGYANIMVGVFIGLWLKLLRRCSGYNIFELLIMLCFVMGAGMLISAVAALLQGLTKLDLMLAITLVPIVYCVWATGDFLGRPRWKNYLVATLAYLLGMCSFWAGIFLVGGLVDWLR